MYSFLNARGARGAIARVLVAASVLLLSACSVLPPVTHHYRNLCTGVSPQTLGKFDKSVPVTLYYVTNRQPSGRSSQEPFYGPDLAKDSQLFAGTIQAAVPRNEPIGGRRNFDMAHGAFVPTVGVKIERRDERLPPPAAAPSSSSESATASNNSKAPPPPPAASLSEFVDQINAENPQKKPILLYLHGFNNTFPFAMKRAARFVHDLGGSDHFVPIVFSWPAVGSIESITRDENNTGPSSAPLAELLRLLLAGDDARTVHMVVHSMGTRIVSQAMLRLSADRPPMNKLENLVITAGDMDAAEFAMPEQVSVLTRHVQRTSIYICDHDVPLYGSMHLHGPSPAERRRPRIGQAGEHRTVINHPQVETIDATLVELSLENHGYLFENRVVIDDVFMLLRHGLAAPQRNLLIADDGKARFYLLRR